MSGDESEDEDAKKEKTGLLSKIADGARYVVAQLDQIKFEVHAFYTEESKKLKEGAFAPNKVLHEVKRIKDRVRTLDTESAVAQVLRRELTGMGGKVFDQVCKNVKCFIDKAPGGESGNDVEAATGSDAVPNEMCKLVMSKVQDRVKETTAQIKIRTGKEVSGLAKALYVSIESLSTKVAPRMAKIVDRAEVKKHAAAAITPTSAADAHLQDEVQRQVKKLLASFEKRLQKILADGIGGMMQDIIAEQVQLKLQMKPFSYAAGISQKLALISQYEKAVASQSRTKDLSDQVRQRMEKFSRASKLSSRVIADVVNQATKYDLPKGYFKRVKMILLASERSYVELMRDAKEIEYVLEQVKALQAGGFTKETWKDSLASWIAFFGLYKQINVQCALAVIECIGADTAVAEAIGAAAPFIGLEGQLPALIMVKLNKGPADHIRKQAYKYITRLERDLSMITKIKDIQARIIALIGAAITAALVSVGNFIARIGFKAYEEGKEVSVMTVIIVVSSVVGCLLLIWALSRSWSTYRSMARGGGAYSRVHQSSGGQERRRRQKEERVSCFRLHPTT